MPRTSMAAKTISSKSPRGNDALPDRLTNVPYVGEFDLETTLTSGQVFHWQRRGDGWEGMIGDTPCFALQVGADLRVHGVSVHTALNYFGLDHPLAEIIASFPHDPAMDAAVAACRGLRIIR